MMAPLYLLRVSSSADLKPRAAVYACVWQGHLFKFLHVMLELPVNHDIRNAFAAKLLTHEDCT